MGRIEAFSDAVLANVLTLLVLELLPHGAQSPSELLENWPTYLAFLISVPWLVLDRRLILHPSLLTTPNDSSRVKSHATISKRWSSLSRSASSPLPASLCR